MKRKFWYGAGLALVMGALAIGGCQAEEKEELTQTDTDTTVEEGAEAGEEVYEYQESGMEKDKEESVYVLADANGTPTEIKVTASLKNHGLDTKLTDKSILTELRNNDGDEEVTDLGNGMYEWQNHGQDIHYEGTADPESELPVTLKVTYYLNDKESSPAELAGANGKIRIRFDYTNNTKKDDEITPFVAITGMMLSEEHAKNVKVENGEVQYMDGDYLIYGFMLPGVSDVMDFDTMELTKEEDIDIPEFMEVSFDATDFELDFTATMYSNGVMESDRFDDLTDKLDELADKLGKASGNATDLKDKIKKLKDGGKNLRTGAETLSNGLGALDEALTQMAQDNPTAYAAISAQVSQLAQGSKALSEGVSAYTSGVDKAVDSMNSDDDEEDTSDYATKADDIRSISDKLKKMKDSDEQYCNFSGLEEGKTGSVSFIIETEEIR